MSCAVMNDLRQQVGKLDRQLEAHCGALLASCAMDVVNIPPVHKVAGGAPRDPAGAPCDPAAPESGPTP